MYICSILFEYMQIVVILTRHWIFTSKLFGIIARVYFHKFLALLLNTSNKTVGKHVTDTIDFTSYKR
jgi:hypothetical protein